MKTNHTSRFRLKNIAEDYRNYYLLLLLVFIILGAIGLAHHEMWRDELEAWLIARDSNSIFALLKNLKYTGHPPLWYFCLYIITRFIQSPWAMQLFHYTNIIDLFAEQNQTSDAVYLVYLSHIFSILFSLIILAIGAIIFYRQPIILFFYTVANFAIIGFI